MYASTPETPLTFPNFDPAFANPTDLYRIGATPESDGRGVLLQMADAFGYKLAANPNEANLECFVEVVEGFSEVVGQTKTLQDNIAGVQERLGTDADAVELTRGWELDTEFLEPVSRAYIHPHIGLPESPNYLTMMSDGIAKWMDWRADAIISLRKHTGFAAPTLLVAGNGVMHAAENTKKVREGMPRADYMRYQVQPYLARFGITAMVVSAETDEGDKVMDAGVWALQQLGYRGPVVLASNGGAWPQNAGELRRAILRADADMHVYVKTDPKAKLDTGAELTRTHQNPFSTAGQIARNHLELFRHIAPQAA